MRFYHLQPGVPDVSMNLPLLTAEFLLDENVTIFEVERSALSDVCALTGGMMFFIYIIVKVLVGKICEQNFVRRIIQRVFVYDDQFLGDL